MSRITNKRLQDKFLLLHNTFPTLELNGAYGLHRVEQLVGPHGSIKEISGFLTNREMWEWLDGALMAVEMMKRGLSD